MPAPDAQGNFGGSWQVLVEAANSQRGQERQGGSPASRTASSASVADAAAPPLPPIDEDDAEWRFLGEQDAISAGDVPEDMRVTIATEGPDLFVFRPPTGEPENTTRLDEVTVPHEQLLLGCTPPRASDLPDPF